MRGTRITGGAAALAALCVLAACEEQTREVPAEGAAVEATDAPVTPAEQAPADGAMMDPNTASEQELQSVPGIDATLAAALVAARPFEDMLEVDSVLAGSLDETARDSVYTRLWYPIDLNTASEEEILLIPGVGSRMQHEFEEYRPYRGIEEFRREIGKYVDEAEVARLERYVTIR